MSLQRDPISVRTTRLNNLILGRGVGSGGPGPSAPSKAAAGRRSTGGTGTGTGTVSAFVAEAVHREGLLDALCLLYNECDKDALKKRDRNIADFVNKFRPIIEETRQLRVNPDDFVVKALIGKGHFGNVHLVVERQTGDVYAMKKIKKSTVTTSQVKEERDIMTRRCSEWIIHLQYAFQDNDNLYLIMEFLPGGDLLSLMSRHGPFDEDWARFYLAELTLAIHALHSFGYVHRDIKPENILIDRFGHLKLADFGNAAALDRDGHVFSLSPVGTPDYIAPELLQTISTYKLTKSMHDVTCDFWSMGIIGYELICEITPFHDENVHDTYSKILSHLNDSPLTEVITYPSDLKLSANYKDLIESLVTNSERRLSYNKIRRHPYFEGVNWESLRSQVPPIIPSINGEEDTSNFDDTTRSKGRASTFHKKSLTSNMKSNDFSGKDLPYIGYSFVHMEKQKDAIDDGALDDHRFSKLNTKIRELQAKLKERIDEISKLKQELLRAEQMAKQSDSKSKILQDAKEEINKMKNTIKDKTLELAACKTQIKTLQSSVKIEEEMREKRETTITDLLRRNRQKYEEAKIASEQRYEKLIAEKKNELTSVVQKLDARESELNAKNDECKHLNDKMKNYKEMLRKLKEQTQADKKQFDKNKLELTDMYEQKLVEARTQLRQEKDTKSRLTMELRDVRTELNDSICSTKSTQEAKNASEKSNDEILKRLSCEVAANNELHAANVQLEQKLISAQTEVQELQSEISRLERELQVNECGRTLAVLATQTPPYETARGSLTELHAMEEQLRTDLEVAKENADSERARADRLQEIVVKLESSMDTLSRQMMSSPSKATPHPAPRQLPTSVGDILEKQNEKLEDKLDRVREQMIVERQAARTANLALWKMEKELADVSAEKKLLKRRMELTEERIKKIQSEREEAQRLCRVAQDETRQRDERIQELKTEITALKREVTKEHMMWNNAEQERMKSKSEIIEHISNVHRLEEQLSALGERLHQTQQTCDSLCLENKRLIREWTEERDKHSAAADVASEMQLKLKHLEDNYEHLKYACTLTDTQLTEVEGMLESEQKRNKEQQEKIDKFYVSLRTKDDLITQLKKELHDEQSEKEVANARIRTLTVTVDENNDNMQEQQKKIISQQQQLMEQTNYLFQAQERIEILSGETQNLQTLTTNYEREMTSLKEENSRILSELFYSKEESHRLETELKDALRNATELQAEIDELQEILAEKESYYLQRDIKSETTLGQHKKLIDYLKLKVEDLSQKKKKTFADMIFGSGLSTKKEINSPGAVECSIVYRTLQEELLREKQRCKTLQEQVDKFNEVGNHNFVKSAHGGAVRSPLKSVPESVDTICTDKSTAVVKSQSTLRHAQGHTSSYHRFELTLMEGATSAGNCVACEKVIVVGSPCWKCKECKGLAHRKCRSDVTTSCDAINAVLENNGENGGEKHTAASGPKGDEVGSDYDGQSEGKYSYEAKLDDADGSTDTNSIGHVDNMGLTLILKADCCDNAANADKLEVNCAYEVEEQKIVLLGCNSGLYAYNMQQPQRLFRIDGVDAVIYIAISIPLSKAILVGSNGESLFQCDFRQLKLRSQTNSTCPKPALEASVLDLPFANRTSSEKWQLVKISNESENPLDSVAIAVTSTRIVILKFDIKIQKFKPVRALDTATSVSSILYTRHTAIVSSDKFFEIDLDNYAAEEFVDIADQSLSHTHSWQPIVAIRISQQEFLLCFSECGVFVDEYGCRSRPYDLNWEYTPTGFLYQEPFLYISHFLSLQIIRLQRSYSKAVSSSINNNSVEADGASHTLLRIYIPLYMPTILAESGKWNAYIIAIQKDTGRQEIFQVNVLKAFKNELNESLETISSDATSIAVGSVATIDSL